MTLASQILTDVDEVFLDLDDFAQAVLRYVGGDASNTKTFTAVVTLDPAAVDDGRGRGYAHRATMVMNSDIPICEGDAIKVGELRYEVVTKGDPQYGMRTVVLNRYQPEVRGGKVFRNGDL